MLLVSRTTLRPGHMPGPPRGILRIDAEALATVNTVLAVLFMSWALTLIGRDQLVTPEFVALALRSNGVDETALSVIGVILVLSIIATSVWDIADDWLKTARDRRR